MAGAAALTLTAALAAAPAHAAPRAKARALAIGTSRDPRASFRLEGRDLTVVLDRRLTPRGFRGRPSVRVVCGDSVKDPATGDAFPGSVLAAAAERSLHVAPGVRGIRARLDANVAARANWCGMRWRSRAGNHFLSAVMTLRRGTPPGCAPTAREQVLADTEALIVTQVNARGASAMRACARPNGAWQPVADGDTDDYGGNYLHLDATAGTRIAVRRVSTHKAAHYDVSLTLIDVRRAAAHAIDVPIRPAGAETGWWGVKRVALDANGRIAWIASSYGVPDEVNARTVDGRTVTLAVGPYDTLTDLAISADGDAVTWREGGVERSASMP